MIRLPPRSTRTDTLFPTRRSSDLKHRFSLQRRSVLGALDGDIAMIDAQVLLGDSMGELFAYFAAADVAFVGGSLVPIGGHNVLEPAALGLPVLFGPHMHNFVAARDLLRSDEHTSELQSLMRISYAV